MKRLVLILCALVATTAHAQEPEKTLHWREIAVRAQLDENGRLHVHERQAMVFNGPWNGGERSFNIRPGQKLEMIGIARIDSAGVEHPLTFGDVDAIDHFARFPGEIYRWRSRMPEDPPFSNREITYDIEYALSKILVPDHGAYLLDHDFAFPDHDGVIERFTVDLDAAPVWHGATPLPLHLEQSQLYGGSTVGVSLPLTYTGAGRPSGVSHSVPLGARLIIALAFLAVVGRSLLHFIAIERARGRFEPLLPVESINPKWLKDNVLVYPPEVVGAAWDNTTSAPEVAAMIARMVQEGKLATRIEEKAFGFAHVLHLELKVPRADLPDLERRLVHGLFGSSGNTTSSQSIRERYKGAGFDPANILRDTLAGKVQGLAWTPPPTSKPHRNVARGVLIGMGAIFSVIAAVIVVLPNVPLFLAPIFIMVAILLTGIPATIYRASVVNTRPKANLFIACTVGISIIVLILILGVFERGAALSIGHVIGMPLPTALYFALLATMAAPLMYLMVRSAQTKESDDRLALRRRLAAARAYFIHELRQPKPALEDEWYPYLVAFGLGHHMDHWFHAFGAESNAVIAATSSMAGASLSSGWSGGGVAFGGGGGFGGGGAGRTWASVAESFSSGVPSPSSSSSGGGGGGGGGSSGGGGGGGW